MAEYISFQPNDYFSAKLWTGTGAENAITGVGFQPDLAWAKQRSGTEYHEVCDAVRGATKILYTNADSAEGTNAQTLKTFDADGYTVGTSLGWNGNTSTYVGWNWKMGTTSGISGGTITPSAYSFSTTSGQSIIAYTGNLTSGATVPHGLGAVPKMIIVKSTSLTANWMYYHSIIATDAETDYLNLNNINMPGDNNTIWNDTAPTSSVFSLGNNTDVNGSGSTYVAYCFADVKGYSKFGSYVGNANDNGMFIYTGFRPAFFMLKRISATGNWNIIDDKRQGFNPQSSELYPNSDAAECDTGCYRIDILSNGIKMRNSSPSINDGTYIYAAFAEFPTVSSNAIPGVAR